MRARDRIAIAAYLGGSDAFDEAVAALASVYAEQNEADFKALHAAVAEGCVPSAKG